MKLEKYDPITITDQWELFLYKNRYNYIGVNLWVDDVLEIDKTLNDDEAREVLFLIDKYRVAGLSRGFTKKEIKKWILYVKKNGITSEQSKILEKE